MRIFDYVLTLVQTRSLEKGHEVNNEIQHQSYNIQGANASRLTHA